MKSKLILALATVSLVTVGCGTKNAGSSSTQLPDSTGIIGGENVTQADTFSKSIVAIFDVKNQGLCTGTILSANLIVTAGHCAQTDPKNLRLVFGVNFESETDTVVLGVESLIVNPGYAATMNSINDTIKKVVQEAIANDPSFDPKHPSKELVTRIRSVASETNNWGDIALLKVRGQIPDGYVPAEILADKNAIQNQSEVLLAGYGITHPDLQAPTKAQLMQTSRMDVAVASNGDADAILLRKVVVSVKDNAFSPTEVLLDQTHGKGACHGDSGGPAFSTVNGKFYVWGVTSRGIKDPDDSCSYYSAYTDMVDHLEWIKQSAAGLGAQFQ